MKRDSSRDILIRIDEEVYSRIEKIIDEKLKGFKPLKDVIKTDELITRNELKDKLKLSLVTIHKLMKLGKLPYKKIGTRVYFDFNEIRALIDGGKL